MKYRIATITPNGAGIYQAPKGWRIHSTLFVVSGQPMRVLLEQISDES